MCHVIKTVKLIIRRANVIDVQPFEKRFPPRRGSKLQSTRRCMSPCALGNRNYFVCWDVNHLTFLKSLYTMCQRIDHYRHSTVSLVSELFIVSLIFHCQFLLIHKSFVFFSPLFLFPYVLVYPTFLYQLDTEARFKLNEQYRNISSC